MRKIVQSCIQHEGNSLFYQASLRERTVTIDLFSSQGVLKLSRNIRVPRGTNQLHATKQYLIGINQQHSKICVSNILHVNQEILITDLNLQNKKIGQISNLGHFFYDQKLNLILFIQDNKNVYEIILQADNISVKNIYNCQYPIDKLQVDSNGRLCLLINIKKILLQVQINWGEGQSVNCQNITENVVDFCFQNGWDLIITEEKQQKRYEEKFNFNIRAKGQFMSSVDISGEQLIFSSQSNIMLIDEKTRFFVMIKNGQMYKFTNILKPQKRLKKNATLVSVSKNEIYETLMIKFLTYNENRFDEFKYERLKIFQNEKRYQSSQINSFDILQKNIKAHISKIFESNGLLNPNYKQYVQKFMIARQIKKNPASQEKIKKQYQKLKDQELSQRFFTILIKQYPKELRILIAAILKDKNCYLQDQLSRFLKFMTKIIHSQVRNALQKYLDRQKQMDEQIGMEEELISSSEQEKHREIQITKQTLITISKVLQTFIRQIQFQYVQTHDKNDSSRSSRDQTVHVSKVGKQYKTIQKKCHSLFLVLDLIQENDNKHQVQAFFKNCSFVRARNQNLAKEICKQIQPLLPYEYFYTVQYIGNSQIPIYQAFIEYLLTNLERFEQIAYFYVSLKQQQPCKFPFINDNLRKYLNLLKTIQFQSKLNENASNSIISQLARLSIQINYYPFIKYVCQISIQFNAFNICNLLLASGVLQASRPSFYNDEKSGRKEDIFIIQAYVSCKKFQACYCWILKKYKFDQQMINNLLVRMINNGQFRSIQRLKTHIHNNSQLQKVGKMIQQNMKQQDYKSLYELVSSQIA